jgi:hypothetical protein
VSRLPGVRALVLLTAAVVLAGCGGAKHAKPATPASALPGGTALYAAGSWAVVVKGDHAVAAQFVGGRWVPDRGGAVQVAFLGPHGTSGPRVQVAASLAATTPLVESGLWVDGEELTAKGGGLTPTKGTIYGTTAAPLAKGRHVAVAYARTATHGTAVAVSFRVV